MKTGAFPFLQFNIGEGKRVILDGREISASVYNIGTEDNPYAVQSYTEFSVKYTDGATIAPDKNGDCTPTADANITVTGEGGLRANHSIKLSGTANIVNMENARVLGTATFIDGGSSNVTINLTGKNYINLPSGVTTAISSIGTVKFKGSGTLEITCGTGCKGISASGYSTDDAQKNVEIEVLEADGYKVVINRYANNGDGTWTWRYKVSQ